ncbi:hypothetical protein HMPREF0765_3583, partial [Sphingobacterium spiritivorum ATCC 33300]
TLNMLRSQARVDVIVEPTLIMRFRMTSVSIYNSSSNARIAPVAANLDPSGLKVTTPSIPASLQINSTPLVYIPDPVNQPFETVNSIRQIYLFEKAKAASAGASEALSLIIGGHYDGSSTETYYKIELLSATATPAPLDLLRNHHYILKIVEISGEGYATKEAALAARPSNMQTSVLTLDGANQKITYFDEQYYLSMNNTNALFASNIAASVNINIQTNAPGWTHTPNGTWFTATKETVRIPNGFGGYSEILDMLVIKAPINTTGFMRQGSVTVTAGKIKVEIDVKQE